jgi:acylpyruvate hydrolase
VKLATIRVGARTRAARVEGDALVELDHADVGAIVRGGPGALDAATTATGPEHALAAADFAPLVTDPGKVMCLGLNYADHIREMGHDLPAFPTLFSKYTDALIGARDPIVLPRVSECTDWEVELAFVIGTAVRHASPTEAEAAIAGFTVANDVSVRDWQNRTLQWLQGKTFEHTTPVGPWLTTTEEVGGPRPALEVRCEVDGVVRQHSRTAQLVFDAPAIVAYASQFAGLHPGDLVLTGTPAGVGHAMDPPVYLQPGQVMRTTIEGIGELVNECVRETGVPKKG